MSKRPRRNHGPAFKAKVALAAVKGEKPLAELARQYDVHPNLVDQWRSRLLEGAADVFGMEPASAEPAVPGVLHPGEDRYQHGRERLLARQPVRGARLALGEIRGGRALLMVMTASPGISMPVPGSLSEGTAVAPCNALIARANYSALLSRSDRVFRTMSATLGSSIERTAKPSQRMLPSATE